MRRFGNRALHTQVARPGAAGPSAALLTVLSFFAVSLAGALLVRNGRAHDETPPSGLIIRQPYAVVVHSERADLDLNFGSDTRYVVVIGSLASSEGRFRVKCSSSRDPAGRIGPIEPLLALGSSPREGRSTGDSPEVQPLNGRLDGPPAGPSALIPASFSTPAGKGAGGTPRGPIPSGSRSFSLHVTDGSLDDPAQYATIHAKAIAEGRQVRVYLDDQQSPSNLAPGLVQEITDLFDRDVIPRFRSLLGTYRDVDQDGRFAVLLSPWLGRLQGGRTSVGGFVRGSDFQTCLGLPFSNRCDMMYVNSQTVPGPHLRTLLIHEYTHAVCFSRRTADACGRPRFPEEEDWLNEAIAHCAESLFQGGWSNLDYRIARFLNDTDSFPLVVGDYYRAGLWRCHGCRGATYLFLRYCLERFGPETLTRLIANPARGTHNLELATGCSFDRLFRGWTLSLVDAARRPAAVSSAAGPALAPLDLYGPLGQWGLAGPRRKVWNVDGGPEHLELAGTAAQYIELCASGPPGPRRLCLEASRGSRIQVSVVRLDDDSPRIEVAAARQAAGDRLQTSVRFVGGKDLTIEQVAAEQNSAEIHASICFAGESLNELQSGPTPHAAVTGRSFDLPAERFLAADVPIVVKAVAVDGRGRRAVAWATVPPRGGPQSERLALHVR